MAQAGITKGAVAVGSNVNITSTPTQGSMTGTDYAVNGVKAPKASATTFTGNVVLTNSSTINSTNNEFTLKVDDGNGQILEHTITLTTGKTGAAAIMKELNDQFTANNLNAIAALDPLSKLVISSTTLGSSGHVELVGGGFIDAFVVDYSQNTGQVTNRGNAGDTLTLNLEGADGNKYNVLLTETVSSEANTATTFAQGTNAAGSANNIMEALQLAIAANEQLAGRYEVTVTGTGSDEITVKATEASANYAIGQFIWTNNGGGLAGTAGTASNVTETISYTVGKDVGDVWIHGDEAASVTGSVVLSNTALSSDALTIYNNNNELTFNLDGVEKTITMATKVYDGQTTTGVGAYQIGILTGSLTNTDTLEVTLGGKTLTYTAPGVKTASNIATALNLSIAADSDLAGKYQATADDNVLVVRALDTDGTVTGMAFNDTDASGNTVDVEAAVAASTPAADTKASNTFLLTTTFGIAAETFEIDLIDATDGSTKSISVASHAADTDEHTFSIAAGALAADVDELVTSLNYAIAAAGLAGQYTATSVADDGPDGTGFYIKIEAAAEGAKYDVGTATITSAAATGHNVRNVDGVVNAIKASNTGESLTAAGGAGDTFKVTLKGVDGVNKHFTFTATTGANSATTFTVGGSAAATAENLREAIQMAIDADWRMADRYQISGTGAAISISALDEGSAYQVSAFLVTNNGGGLTSNGAGSVVAGQTGQTSNSLRVDLQAKINAEFKSTVTDTVTGAASTGDTYSISLQGYNGDMVTINLTASNANSVTTWNAGTATTEANATALAAALTLAIADNSQLAGRYTATADGDDITITAAGFGEGSRIEQSSDNQVAIGSIFAVTNGAASDERSLAVSYDSANNIVLTSNKTDETSCVNALGSNLADTLFGAVGTRNVMAKQDANNTLQLQVDGVQKTIDLAKQVYQDLDEFISVNAAAFTAAGVTASNEDGVLKLTSNATGAQSSITNVVSGDAAKQLGLVQANGSALQVGHFVQGADGNTTLRVTVDGETVDAVIT